MYSISLITNNQNADPEFFNKWLKDNFEHFIGCTFLNPPILYFLENPTGEQVLEINNKYSSLTQNDILTIDNIIHTYSIREQEGHKYYNEVRADLSILFTSGALTIENAVYIEKKLITVKNFLLSGDWATAQYEISNNVVIGGVVSTEDVSNGYTQQFHDDIKNYIDNFVLNNY